MATVREAAVRRGVDVHGFVHDHGGASDCEGVLGFGGVCWAQSDSLRLIENLLNLYNYISALYTFIKWFEICT